MSTIISVPASPAVIIENACLHYRGTTLFSALNLTLAAGKWTCLLGKSGIGKSSLLRLIAQLPLTQAQSSGTIKANDHQPLSGRIAYMAQNDLLMPWLSVLENVLLGQRLRKCKTTNNIDYAWHLLEQMDLKYAAHLLPAELSGGMRQRVALARTLLENKPVILMDEPFSALDALTRYRLQTLAATLLKNRTVLLVTHDPIEALRLGHHVYVMSGAPAHLNTAIEPEGLMPRDPTDSALLKHYVNILEQLA